MARVCTLTHTVAQKLESCTYVTCVLIDYTKASDIIKHSNVFIVARQAATRQLQTRLQCRVSHFHCVTWCGGMRDDVGFVLINCGCCDASPHSLASASMVTAVCASFHRASFKAVFPRRVLAFLWDTESDGLTSAMTTALSSVLSPCCDICLTSVSSSSV